MTAALLLAVEEATYTRISVYLVVAVVLLVFNALFVAYEFALLAASRQTVEADAEGGGRAATSAAAAMSNVSLHLAGAQLGITICTVLLGFVAEPAVGALLLKFIDGPLAHGLAVAISIGVALSVVTFFHLVGAEMVPKNIAIAVPERTLRLTVLPYTVYLRIFRPVVWFLNTLANWGCRVVGVEPRDELVSAPDVAELAAIVGHSSSEGAIEADDADMIQVAIQLAERPVADIARELTPENSIRWGETYRNALNLATSAGEKRIPVIDRIGNGRVMGYVHARDLLGLDERALGGIIPTASIRRMAVFEGPTPLIEVLRQMRASRSHLAQVRTPDGAPRIVSIEEVVAGFAEGPDASLLATLAAASPPPGGHH